MEDAEQVVRRREIRRKKILENSDARWMKIIGQDKQPVEDAAKEKGIPVPTQTKQEPPSSLVPSETKFTSLGEQTRLSFSLGDGASQFLSEELSATVGTSSPSFTQLAETRTRSLDESSAAANGVAQLASSQRSASYSFPKKVSDTESRSYSRCRSDNRGSDEGALSWLLELLGPCGPSLLRTWLLGLVATVTRLWLALGTLGGVQTILLPFCLLETAMYSYWKFSSKPSLSQRPTRPTAAPLAFLGTALLLCGVSPKVSSRTTACLQLLTDLVVDLMVYTFSFVVFHVIWDDWVG